LGNHTLPAGNQQQLLLSNCILGVIVDNTVQCYIFRPHFLPYIF